VTALGNEGFLIEAGEDVVLVDGLYHGLGGYFIPSEQQREARERAEPPFDAVDLVLASHHHPDHFDAVVVRKHLIANPGGVLVTTPMAVDLLHEDGDRFQAISPRVRALYPNEGEIERIEIGGIRVEVFNLHHGRNRSLPAQNLGFVVEMSGLRFLHIGDTLATATELAALGLAERAIDVAFVPYWHLLDGPGARKYLEAIGATTVVAMHLPAADAPRSYLDPAQDLEGLIRIVEEAAPGVIVFADVMERREIRTGD
jgi:L-ascorbate metabolism protein UlaG (beta-lactamase superfamily)